VGSGSSNWIVVTESQYPWEREALDYVRARFPTHEPYLAWTNFEFVADDGAVYEVDLLVLTPKGLFLVELKGRPGQVQGDAGTWTWTTDGRSKQIDNPLLLANRKAKKLKSLLERQDAWKKNVGRGPFLQALIFLSDPAIDVRLDEQARHGVCGRDVETGKPTSPGALPGIIAAVQTIAPEQYQNPNRVRIDRVVAKGIARAVDQAGIRRSQRARQVRDYQLGRLLFEGPGYQDFEARHVSLASTQRRVRIYTVARAGPADLRQTIARAARREFEALEGIQHPGILRAVDYTEHELGPALFFDAPADAPRLDLFLVQHGHKLGVDQRLSILRQTAEAVQYAHARRLYHRALSPQSVLVTDPSIEKPRVQLFNWQTAVREIASTSAHSGHGAIGTAHLEDLIEAVAAVYLAPETMKATDAAGETLDVFSLGAVAYHLFSGRPPATHPIELQAKLLANRGLQLPDTVDCVTQSLQELIRQSTIPDAAGRMDSADEFLQMLEKVEDELTAPANVITNPLDANKGDLLPGNFRVLERLGVGSTSIVFEVEAPGEKDPLVLKVSSGAAQDARIRDEADVLSKLKPSHSKVVRIRRLVDVGERAAILMDSAGRVTLRQRIRRDGRLTVDLLQRFGDDLLDALQYLDEHGIAHRDVKPDNLGVMPIGRGDTLHVVLFDFSLSRTSADETRAGTPHYLEPFLSLRRPPRWDVHAEHFAAAVTLYEMATGVLPRWGDGKSDAAVIPDEVTVESDLFDAEVREPLTRFFRKALRRDFRERFHNIHELRDAWREVFAKAEPHAVEPETEGIHPELERELTTAKAETPVVTLPFTTRAQNALNRADVITIRDLLRRNPNSFQGMRGVGSKTKRELHDAIRFLAERLPDLVGSATAPAPAAPTDDDGTATDSLDRIAHRLLVTRTRKTDTLEARTLRAFLGVAVEGVANSATTWPSQSDLADRFNCTRQRIGQIVLGSRKTWTKLPAITTVRDELVGTLRGLGGIATADELASAVRSSRAGDAPPDLSAVQARAVIRAAIEVESGMKTPRLDDRRIRGRAFVALDEPDAQAALDYLQRLGPVADAIAASDPLPSPAGVEQKLREVPVPAGMTPLAQDRLVRLAALASEKAAASPRLELYPRGMPADRALNLARGAIAGMKQLSVDDIRRFVSARYPEAAPLPDREELDRLLEQVEMMLVWKEDVGAFVLPTYDPTGVSSRSFVPRTLTERPTERPPWSPELAEARAFHERLDRAAREGAFLVLKLSPKEQRRAVRRLVEDFGVEPVDFDALLIEAMRAAATGHGIDWTVVLSADSAPEGSADAANLRRLVGTTMATVEQDLIGRTGTVLLTNVGLLARWNRMRLLEGIRDRLGSRTAASAMSMRGLWVLVPAEPSQSPPVVDGKAIPVITPAQWASIPQSWLIKVHRSGGAAAAPQETRA
jgi:serine/threonine protein kinase